MNEHPIAKVLGVIAAWFGWFGAITLAQVQTIVAILSGLVVAGYAATQWWILWRDKIRKDRE